MVESQVPHDLLYTREHHWIKVEEGVATFGLTDHAQNELGDVVYIELPEVGREYHASDEIGTLESVKATTELYVPLSGEVIEVNENLDRSPGHLNRDPYGDGWIARVRMSDPSEIEDLLTAKDYAHIVEEGE